MDAGKCRSKGVCAFQYLKTPYLPPASAAVMPEDVDLLHCLLLELRDVGRMGLWRNQLKGAELSDRCISSLPVDAQPGTPESETGYI